MRFIRDPDDPHCIIDTDNLGDMYQEKFWAWTHNEQVCNDVLNRLNKLDEENKRLKNINENTAHIYNGLMTIKSRIMREPHLTCKVPRDCKHSHGCRHNLGYNMAVDARRELINEIIKIFDESK